MNRILVSKRLVPVLTPPKNINFEKVINAVFATLFFIQTLFQLLNMKSSWDWLLSICKFAFVYQSNFRSHYWAFRSFKFMFIVYYRLYYSHYNIHWSPNLWNPNLWNFFRFLLPPPNLWNFFRFFFLPPNLWNPNLWNFFRKFSAFFSFISWVTSV